MRTLLLVSAVAAALSACDAHLTAPGTGLDGLPEGLQVELTVNPTSVSQGDAFDVTFTVANTTTDTIRVTTAHGCLATPHVMRDGRRVPIAGSWYGCTAAITTHTFAPGETLTHVWEMRAELYGEQPGDVDGRPAPWGVYTVRAEFDTYGAGATKPVIERTLLVQ